VVVRCVPSCRITIRSRHLSIYTQKISIKSNANFIDSQLQSISEIELYLFLNKI